MRNKILLREHQQRPPNLSPQGSILTASHCYWVIGSYRFLGQVFCFDLITGDLRWADDRPVSHFRDYASYRQWVSKKAGTALANSNKVGISYQGTVRNLTPAKVAAVLATGVSYDDVMSVRFHDGDRSNLHRENLRVRLR